MISLSKYSNRAPRYDRGKREHLPKFRLHIAVPREYLLQNSIPF